MHVWFNCESPNHEGHARSKVIMDVGSTADLWRISLEVWCQMFRLTIRTRLSMWSCFFMNNRGRIKGSPFRCLVSQSVCRILIFIVNREGIWHPLINNQMGWVCSYHLSVWQSVYKQIRAPLLQVPRKMRLYLKWLCGMSSLWYYKQRFQENFYTIMSQIP